MENIEKAVETIAREVLRIDTLKTQDSDALDFHEVSVWNLKQALERAYNEGAKGRVTK